MIFGKRQAERKELEQLRRLYNDRLEDDIRVLRKCINACGTAISINVKTIEKTDTRVKKLEKKIEYLKEEEKTLEDKKMFG